MITSVSNRGRTGRSQPVRRSLWYVIVDIFAEQVRFFQMRSLVDLRLSVGITAAASQQHPPVVEADVVDDGKPVIGYRLLKGPEEVVRRRHQQGAVLHGILLVASQRRVGIFLRDAVEPFDKRLDPG